MLYRLLTIIALWTAATAQGQELKIGDLTATDPSTEIPSQEKFRFVADFNNDGVPDVAIAFSIGFGNAGGLFSLYLGAGQGKWRYMGDLFAHPLAVHLEKGQAGEGVVTVYARSGGSSGSIIRSSVTEQGIKQLSDKEIHPGDGGTDEGRAEYARYFAETVRLPAEVSTLKDGKTIWSNYPPYHPSK